MTKYETVYIIDTEQENDAIKELIEKFKGVVEEKGGQVSEIEEWARERLIYPIANRREGYYVLMNLRQTLKRTGPGQNLNNQRTHKTHHN